MKFQGPKTLFMAGQWYFMAILGFGKNQVSGKNPVLHGWPPASHF